MSDYSVGQASPGQAMRANAIKPPPQPQTQMEALSERIGTAKRRLININDALSVKLDNFNPTPQQVGQVAGADPEPTPGTLASLRIQSDRLLAEIERLEVLAGRITEII